MIEAIIFDIGGVLLDQSNDKTLEYIAERFNLPIENVKERIYDNLDLLQKSTIDEKEYWIRFAEKVDRELPSDYTKLWTKEFIKGSKVKPDMLLLLQDLRYKGYKIGALSNTINNHAFYLRGFFNVDNFDAFVLSNEIGKRKPDGEAYQYVIDKLDIRPGQGVFIDNKKEFVDAAVGVGLIGIQYRDTDQLKHQLRTLFLL